MKTFDVTGLSPEKAKSPLKIVFAGTPEFAAGHLQTLIDSEHEVIAVYTQPDRPAGRGKKLQPSPVKVLALNHSLPVYQPPHLKSAEEHSQLMELKLDIMIVVAYGLILPQTIIDIPSFGCLNVHASILPRWRGAAPIQHAIWAKDTESGVTIMQMDVGLDTGDMLNIATTEITPRDTASSLHDRLLTLGQSALLHTLSAITFDALTPQKQEDSKSTYARKLEKHDGLLNWQHSAEDLDFQIRALTPWPGCYSFIGDIRFKVWNAQVIAHVGNEIPGTILETSSSGILIACQPNALLLTELQMPGKKRLKASDVLNSNSQCFKKHYILSTGE